MIQKAVGAAGYLILAGNRVEATELNPKFDPDWVESTDSSNFDSNTNMLWESQLPGKMKGTIDVTANFDLGSTNQNVFPLLYSPIPIAAQVYINASRKLYDGSWNVKNLDDGIPIKDPNMFTAKFQLMSSGVINAT